MGSIPLSVIACAAVVLVLAALAWFVWVWSRTPVQFDDLRRRHRRLSALVTLTLIAIATWQVMWARPRGPEQRERRQ